MPDDCPVNDESRRALRELARRAEWRGQPGTAGAAQDARTLRELGSEIENTLAREPDTDASTWAYRATASLAAYSRRAQPDWTVEQIAELARLREDAITALAPGPGESQADPAPKPTRRSALSALSSRRPAVLALAVVSCLVLIALILTLPHLLSNDSSQTPAASATTTFPATPTTQVPTTPPATASDTSTPTTSSTSSASASAPATSASASSADNSTVTAIQINNTDDLPGSPPEVIVTDTITASGTGDITVNISITGSSGQPQVVQQVPESDQTSYSDLTQTINLSQWCGQSSVTLTISSGSVSQSVPVSISGC